MAARTTTVATVFSALYNTLRRTYADYATVFSGELYIVFANLFLMRQARIPYYLKFDSAYQKSTPDGYLPVNLSSYYFREVPVKFYPKQMEQFLGGTDPLTLQPIFQLTPFVDGKYRTVFVCYDPAVMQPQIKFFNAMVMDTNAALLVQLDKVVKENVRRLEVCWNQLQLLAQAFSIGRYTNKKFIEDNSAIVTRDVNTLQNIDRTIVYKLCKECKDNARLAGYEPVLIASTAALSLEYIGSGVIDKAALENNIRFKSQTGEAYAKILNAIAVEWRTTQSNNGEQRIPTPGGGDQKAFYYSPMDNVTVTATKKNPTTASNQNNSTGKYLPWILGAGALLLLANDKKGK